MASAESQTAGQSASATTSGGPASAMSANAPHTAETPGQTVTSETASHHEHKTLTVTLPVDLDTVNAAGQAATTAVMVPITTAKNILQSPNAGLPAYIGIAGLAAVGLVEWPVAAVAGVGLACLRRWGALRPESAEAPKAKVTPAAEPVAAPAAEPAKVPAAESVEAPAPPARHPTGE